MDKIIIANDCGHCDEECNQSHICRRHVSNHEKTEDDVVMIFPKVKNTLCKDFWAMPGVKK